MHMPTAFQIMGLVSLIMPAVVWFVLSGRHKMTTGLWCGGWILLGMASLLIGSSGYTPSWALFQFSGLLLFGGHWLLIQTVRHDLAVTWRLAGVLAAPCLFVLSLQGVYRVSGNLLLCLQYVFLCWALMAGYLSALAGRIARQEQSQSARWAAGLWLLVAVSHLSNAGVTTLGISPPLALDANPARIFFVLIGILNAVISNLAYVGLAFERSQRRETEADKQYRAILETITEGFFVCDTDRRITDLNLAFCDLLGYDRGTLLGISVEAVEASENADQIRAHAQRIMQTGYDRFETRYRRKDGRVLDIELSVNFLPINPGKFLVFARDITERKLTEEALRSSEERLRLITDTAPVILVEVDRELCYRFVNRHYASLFGLPPEHFLGQAVSHVMGGKAFTEAQPYMLQALAGQTVEFEIELPQTSDGCRYMSAHYVPKYDESGQVAGFIGAISDITARRRAEESVRISGERLRLITDIAPVILLEFDRKLCCRFMNRRAADVFDLSPSAVCGRHVRAVIGEEAFAVSQPYMLKALAGKAVEFEAELPNTPHGRKFMAVRYAPIRDESGRVTGFVAAKIDITERKRTEEEIKQLAFYDSLTQLPNRRLLLDRLQQAQVGSARSKLYNALLFIDLDNFKVLNDTLGHDKGDLLLLEVSERLAACVRECDTVARLGGDEFVVMLTGLGKGLEDATLQTQRVGRKILGRLNQVYNLAGHEHHGSGSVGVTLFVGHQCAVEELLKQADIALYQAKAEGRNTLRFFDLAMQTAINTRVALSNDLRHALAKNQLKLYFQPEVCHTLGIIGFEVLLRWEHPEHGLLLPAAFIPLAEETGLIHLIGQWVLESACALLKSWEGKPEWQNRYLAVNVSVRQFHQPDFAEFIIKTLQNSRLSPGKLMLELTESAVLDDTHDATDKMRLLKQIGVRFALDDFGTGYSSLAYLTRLPFDQLKIDRSFVHNIGENPADAVIIQTIVVMANQLGIGVIAEGVETEAQYAFLQRLGCQLCQGYWFGALMNLAVLESAAAGQSPGGLPDGGRRGAS